MRKAAGIREKEEAGWEEETMDGRTDSQLTAIVAISESAEGIEEIHNQLIDLFTTRSKSFEIIYVDNGVGGERIRWLEEQSGKNHRIKIIRFRSVFSESSALDAGYQASRGDLLLYMTTRVRVDPKGLSRLLDVLDRDQDTDIVVGWRYPRSDSTLNQWVSHFFNRMTSYLGGLDLHDLNSGVFVARKEVLRDVLLYGDLDKFLPLLAHKQGYHVAEEKIAQLSGKFRISFYLKEYFVRLLDIITIVFLTNYSKKPIHFLGFVGLLFSLTGGILSLYLFVYRITGQGPIAGRPLLLLGILLFVIGIQMIAIGLLGEMMIYIHASDIKEYNIEEIVEHEDN